MNRMDSLLYGLALVACVWVAAQGYGEVRQALGPVPAPQMKDVQVPLPKGADDGETVNATYAVNWEIWDLPRPELKPDPEAQAEAEARARAEEEARRAKLLAEGVFPFKLVEVGGVPALQRKDLPEYRWELHGLVARQGRWHAEFFNPALATLATQNAPEPSVEVHENQLPLPADPTALQPLVDPSMLTGRKGVYKGQELDSGLIVKSVNSGEATILAPEQGLIFHMQLFAPPVDNPDGEFEDAGKEGQNAGGEHLKADDEETDREPKSWEEPMGPGREKMGARNGAPAMTGAAPKSQGMGHGEQPPMLGPGQGQPKHGLPGQPPAQGNGGTPPGPPPAKQ